METTSLVAFAAILAAACAVPGPTVAALVARVLGRGFAGAPAFCLGLLLGDLVSLAGAVFGLAMVVALFQPVFLAVKHLGAAYLLYLGWRMWTAPPAGVDVPAASGEGARLALAGFAVAVGNPKTMLFYLVLLPTVVPIEAIGVGGYAELALVLVAVYAPILAAYVLLAERARRAFRSPRAMRLVNRGTGAVMAGAAVAIAARS